MEFNNIIDVTISAFQQSGIIVILALDGGLLPVVKGQTCGDRLDERSRLKTIDYDDNSDLSSPTTPAPGHS